MHNQSEYNELYKIVLIGDSGVGKTNIMSQYVTKEFKEDTKTTIGVEFAHKNITIDNKVIKVSLWDTAGQDRYRAITSSYYKGAAGALIVYDITSKQSFENVEKWLKELRESANEDIKIILIGNKVDLRHLRQVQTDVSILYAQKNNLAFMETSAKNGSNIDEAYNKLISEIHQYNQNLSSQPKPPVQGVSILPQSQPKTCC